MMYDCLPHIAGDYFEYAASLDMFITLSQMAAALIYSYASIYLLIESNVVPFTRQPYYTYYLI